MAIQRPTKITTLTTKHYDNASNNSTFTMDDPSGGSASKTLGSVKPAMTGDNFDGGDLSEAELNINSADLAKHEQFSLGLTAWIGKYSWKIFIAIGAVVVTLLGSVVTYASKFATIEEKMKNAEDEIKNIKNDAISVSNKVIKLEAKEDIRFPSKK